MSEPFNPLPAFAHWIAEADKNWSTLALTRAANAFLDTLGVMLPGMQEEVVTRLTPLAERWGKGDCTVPLRRERLSAPTAALVHGTAAHALDFDDNFDPAKAHASAVLVPAILAVADARGLSGPQMIDAYIVGLQIMGRVGQGINPYHRSRGWHATATVGAVGAAAAIARLIGLKEAEAAHAVSMSTSYAGGFMSQFGTMTKPLHAGLAAAGGVQAAEAAEAGITAGHDTLSGKTGMRTLMVGPDVEDIAARMKGQSEYGQTTDFASHAPGAPLLIEEVGLKVKRYPNCGSVHRALDGYLDLHHTHGLSAERVAHILVRAPAAHLRNLMYDNPENGMQAKFSLEYGLAVAMLRGNASVADYYDDNIMDADVRALFPKVRKDYVEKLESEFDTEVHVTLTDGSVLSTSVNMPVGSSARPFTQDQLEQKFLSAVQPSVSPDTAIALKTALIKLPEGGSARSLLSLLVVQ